MDSTQIAAVDLGSNSFRLQLARAEGGHIYPLDSLRFPVRLAAGLEADKTLSEETQTRALTALTHFGERLRGFSPKDVRVVGTNTLRVAHDKDGFIAKAEAALGFPIEIISGYEEARLIYLGAAHSLPPFPGHRLVIDIGGGSTEFIIGQQLRPLVMESLRLGCVSFSKQYFVNGRCDKKAFREAEIAAAREIETLVETYRNTGWQMAVGTSGTAKALAELLSANSLLPESDNRIARQGLELRWLDNGPGWAGPATDITRKGLESLKLLMIRAGNIGALRLNGLSAERQPVIAGGLAIMLALFDTFGIDDMVYADGALRQGVLYDLRGRINHLEDLRPETIRQLQSRYLVPQPQAKQVSHLALDLFDLLQEELPNDEGNDESPQFLEWAAQLHEMGWAISHTSYHKHGAYIVTHSDMPGFSKSEQARLSALILGHRGKLVKSLHLLEERGFRHSLLALRLAVLFCRGRTHSELSTDIRLFPVKGGYQLTLSKEWIKRHTLSEANLREESAYWQATDYRLLVDA